MDRHFTEEEAREVFARAAERQHAAVAKGEGLSLDELRAIGAEAGLDPAHVEAAARSVALGEPETGRLAVGPLPRGVFRTGVLPGPPTDALWASVVADARRTFAAQGKLAGAGRIREWRNGNLRVTLEPEGDGARLHLQTRRTERTQLTLGGAFVALMALGSAFLSSLDAGADGGGLGSVLMLAVLMGAAVAAALVEQRRWAATREAQFDEVTRRAAEAQAAGTSAAGALAAEASATETAAGRIDPALLDADAGADGAPGADRRRVR